MKTKLISLVASVLTLAFASANAQSIWSGANGTLWSDAANWDVLPGANSTLTFNGSTNTSNINDFSDGTLFGGLAFGNATGANFTLSGNAITLGGDVTTNAPSDNATRSSAIQFDLILNGNRTFFINGAGANATTLALSGNLSASGGPWNLQKEGTGTLVLSGNNTHDGDNTISGGTLVLAHDKALGIGPATILNSGTTLVLSGNVHVANPLTISDTGDTKILQTDDTAVGAEYSGNILIEETGANLPLFKTGTGETLALSGIISGGNATGLHILRRGTAGDYGLVVVSGNNTYAGNTTIGNEGVVRAAHSRAFSSGRVSLASNTSTLELADGVSLANDLQVDSVGTAKMLRLQAGASVATLGGNITNNEAANQWLVDAGANGTLTLGGVISGSGGLTKNGAGRVLVSNNNTYSLSTNVNNGTLAAGQSGAFSTGNVSLADTNTTLELANGVVLANTVSVANAGTAKYINLADNAVAATLAGNVTILETSAGNFISSVGANGTLTITGNITGSAGAGLRKEGSGNLTLAGANTYTGQVWISDGTVNVASLAANLGGNTTVKLAQAGGSIGTLRYTGAGETFSRQILIGNANAGTARIVNDGSGALLFDNATFNGEQGAAIPFNRTLSLGGSNAGNNTISGVIANSSNVFIRVTKTDAGKWILAGNNTYTGNTTVAGGTLALGSPFLNDNSTVYLSSNTTLNLDFNGTDTVNALYIDNVQQTNGTWGGTGSGAANTSALITGSGWLDVTTGGGGGPSANVTFTSAGQNVAETAGTAILTVTATGTPTGTITANVTFDSGNSTASAGDIGSYSTQLVTLNAGNSYTANVTVTVTDDAAPEANETALFNLADLTGSAVLGSPSVHTLTILANDSFAEWAAGYSLNGSLTDNFDGDKFTDGEEYAFDLDPTTGELGNVLASATSLSGGNVTMTLAFSGNSAKEDINYVVRRANNPGFTSNTVVGQWNGTNNWTTSNSTYFGNETQTGAGDVKAINVNMSIPAATEPRQFLKVNIE